MSKKPIRFATLVAVVVGGLIAVAGFAWFGTLFATPWAGWDSPIGSIGRSLHGIAALGCAALLPLATGLL